MEILQNQTNIFPKTPIMRQYSCVKEIFHAKICLLHIFTPIIYLFKSIGCNSNILKCQLILHIYYGNSDRKEMFIIERARNLTTIKKSLSSQFEYVTQQWNFPWILFLFKNTSGASHNNNNNFFLFHADFDCKGLLLRTLYEKNIIFITGSDFFFFVCVQKQLFCN